MDETAFFTRVKNLIVEKLTLCEDIKALTKEAKEAGVDVKTVKRVALLAAKQEFEKFETDTQAVREAAARLCTCVN